MNNNSCQAKATDTAEDPEPPQPVSSIEALLDNGAIPLDEQITLTNIVQDKVVKTFDAVKASSRAKSFARKFFPEATIQDWNDWHWQLRNQVHNGNTLSRFLNLSDHEELAINKQGKTLPFAITPYFLSLLDCNNAAQPLRRTMIPVIQEFLHCHEEALDPLGEDGHTTIPGLVHRYPDRVLFLASNVCAAYCRYCTRSRMISDRQEGQRNQEGQWDAALEYIRSHQQIRDVLISGGDPLMLVDEKLDYLLSQLRKIRHVEFIRIGTKTPVVLPQRITRSLIRMFKKHRPLWISIHFTHPDELTPETREACARLADAGIPLGSQTVLLKGVNDNLDTMTRLVHGLLKIRVRPYYLYQCDPIVGSSHFRTPVKSGLDIIKGLRGFTSGYAIPHYVIDAPGGGGKIPLLPEYAVGYDGGNLVLRNYEDKIFYYPDAGT
jgi:lysine 2,3-aminomutase